MTHRVPGARRFALLVLLGSGGAACGAGPSAPTPIARPPIPDLAFYRQLVRDGYELALLGRSDFQPIRRWTRTPAIYLQTIDDRGLAIDAVTLAMIDAVVRDAVPRWTGGALGVPIVARGTETREGQAGWITVQFRPLFEQKCGAAQIAVDGGLVFLFYPHDEDGPYAYGCRVGGWQIAPRTVRHEFGHALGFSHTDGADDVMGPTWTDPDLRMSPRELAAAAVAYTRPVGNTDIDTDPAPGAVVSPASRVLVR